MNVVPIIRKNSYKDYLGTSVLGGFMIGLIFGLIALFNSHSIVSLYIGIALWMLTIIITMTFGFPRQEYFKRKKRIAKLQSEQYTFLYEKGFQLHEDLYFEGFYEGYFFRIIPLTKWFSKKHEIEYVVIEAYYFWENDKMISRDESNLDGLYFIGELNFANSRVSYLPKDCYNPDFKYNMDGLVSILKRVNLMPLSKVDWDREIGKRLIKEKEEELESRTVHLVRIGKILNLKYTREEKQKA